jgi:thiol-disulfide isomerase/thioredoxin
MLQRLIVLVVFCTLLYVAYKIVERWQLSKTKKGKDLDPLLTSFDLSIPTIVYFTTPMCALCRTTQVPALERLKDIIDNVCIIKVVATEHPEVAQRWGILSVPTTFVTDRNGHATNVNNGFVDELKLSSQIQHTHRLAVAA